MRTGVREVGAAALAVALAGCAAVGLGGAGPVYRCGAISVPLDVLENGRPATDLDAAQRAGLRQVTADLTMDVGDLAGWRIVTASGRRVVILGPPQADHVGDGSPVNSVVAADRGDGGWQLDVAGACELGLELDGLGNADVRLDPGAPAPTADATELHLLVTERACAGGESAEGRVRVVSQRHTDDELQIAVGVEPRAGDQECPGNPETPFTLRLEEPLGDRTVSDATTYPTSDIGP